MNNDELLYGSGLTELTEEFLSSVGYPRNHKSWSEWEVLAREYGLTDELIIELEQFLEQNQQLTVPIRFNGRQYWLTKQEIKHLNLIKQYFLNWGSQVDKIMNRMLLGDIEKDYELQTLMKSSSHD